MFAIRALARVGIWRGTAALSVVAAIMFSGHLKTQAQGLDCSRLRAQIASMGSGGGGASYARAAQKQARELSRTQAYAHQLGCDSGGFLFFGGGGNDPKCAALNARINQMQANLSRLQSGGGGGAGSRGDLVARYNAYCRGDSAPPPRERGFFESLFGGGAEQPRQPPLPDLPTEDPDGGGDGPRGHGGSQAVCVRTCDGGFFPMGMSSHHSAESLTEMCTALCPGTEAQVFTRSPDAEIKSAMSLDGKAYMDLPNALKFQKNFTSTCSCQPAGKSWAESLTNAETLLGSQRKGDILVTQEKSDEMSRPRMDPRARAALLKAPGTTKISPEDAGHLAANPGAVADTVEVTGPDGVKRLVRRVGPQN